VRSEDSMNHLCPRGRTVGKLPVCKPDSHQNGQSPSSLKLGSVGCHRSLCERLGKTAGVGPENATVQFGWCHQRSEIAIRSAVRNEWIGKASTSPSAGHVIWVMPSAVNRLARHGMTILAPVPSRRRSAVNAELDTGEGARADDGLREFAQRFGQPSRREDGRSRRLARKLISS